MKRFLTCALCFVSLPAIAVPLYYEQDGACPGLYSSQPLTGCNATTVAKLNVTPINGTVFNGFFINGQKVVNADGTFTNNALNILRGADLTSGAEIPQTYTCSNGVTETGYGECQSGTPLVTVKLDTRGGSMAAPTQVKVAHGGTLTAYAPDRSSFDGAIFVGWAKPGQDYAAARNAVINDTPGSTVTYRAVYSCPDGYYMNQYNVCVSDGDDYFDDRGNNIPAGNLQCWRPTGPNGTYQNYCHWNVKITFHNNNQGFSLTSGTQNDGMVLTCYGGRGCDNNNSCASNNSSGKCTHLYQPKANDYWFRGYFRLNDKEVQNPSIVIVEENNDRAAYNNFYPKTMMGNTMSITGHAVVAMSDSIVELDCRPFGSGTTGDWITNPDGTTYCDGMVTDTNQFSLDVYGGWARKCAESTTTNPLVCSETIGSAYYANQGFLKGRVRYDTSCADGYTISGGNSTYNPQCVREAGSTLNLTYQFVDQHGLPVDGCNIDAYESCTTSDTYYLPHQAVCGSNNPLKYLSTYSGLYTPNRPVTCGSSVFGTSPATRVVTGYVCRYSCEKNQSIENGTCVLMPKQSGTINGNEYTDNLWGECNKIECNRGYTLQIVNGTATCVSSGGDTCTPGRYCSTETDCTNIGGTCATVNSNGCLCAVTSCSFGTSCLVATCNSIGGECQSTNGSTCICVQPGTGNDDEPEWVAVEFKYGNVTLTSPASPTTFYLDKKRKCYYAYTQPVSKDNCGLNSPYRLTNITIPTAQGKTFAGFWRESQSLRIIDADGNVRATNQGIDQLTFNSSATATVMYLTAHWN